ncbi:MAG: glycosyltransferase [Opitutus sp.]
MKILLVQDYLRSGGTERQSVLLANALSDAGHVTTLLTFRPGGALNSTVGPQVHRISLQRTDTTLDWFAPGLRRATSTVQPDVILCMGRMANCYAGNLQRRFPKSSVIATMRTGKTLPLLFRRSLRAVRHVVANSEDARASLIRTYAVPADKVTVIYNSLVFPPVSLTPRDEAMRRTQGATANTIVLLCVAMFRPEKNQRELVEIAATFSPELDWQLWLAGDGPCRAECERLASAKNLNDRVKSLGLVQNPSSLYAAADVAVHASSSESLSNFLIEAQAHGLPAVAYSAQGISETFIPSRTGWEIPRGDRTLFCERIELLAQEPEAVRKARATEAQTFARNTFDPATQVARYVDLFARLQSR